MLRLQQLEMHHPLLGTTALRQQAYSHYMRVALPELVKLVGSANLLGDILQSKNHHLPSCSFHNTLSLLTILPPRHLQSKAHLCPWTSKA